MEPKSPETNIGPEQSSANYSPSLEQAPQSSTPETGFDAGAEQVEQRSESAPAAVTAPPVLPVPYPTTVPQPTIADDTATPVVDDTPVVANDDDLIEKEWVDKAKQIIVQTKDDPYRREQEVSKLQTEYLRKRYGKELGSSQ